MLRRCSYLARRFSSTLFENDFITEEDEESCLWLPAALGWLFLAPGSRVESFHKWNTLCSVRANKHYVILGPGGFVTADEHACIFCKRSTGATSSACSLLLLSSPATKTPAGVSCNLYGHTETRHVSSMSNSNLND